jgi:hypothetical protein
MRILNETFLIRPIKRGSERFQNPAKKLPASKRFCKEDSSKKQVDNWLDIRLMELSI